MKRIYWQRALFTLGLLVTLSSCRGSSSTAQPTILMGMTPKAGGMILPTAMPAPAAAGDQAVLLPAEFGLRAGQLVVVVSPDGLKLQSDATLVSEVRGLYPMGATLIVLAPIGNYPAYPVQSDNHDWYRFQAGDGLVGWAMIEAIVPAGSLPTATATPAG